MPENGAGLSRWERRSTEPAGLEGGAWQHCVKAAFVFLCVYCTHVSKHVCAHTCACDCEGPRLTSGAFLSCSLFGRKWLY